MTQMTTENRGVLLDVAIRAAADGTVTFPLSSETPYLRHDGNEILDHGAGLDLSWLNSGNAPLLDNHDRYSGVRAQIGVITKAWVDARRLYVSVKFSARAEAQAIRQDVIDGILRNVSVGYEILETVRSGDGKSYTVTKWRPTEASFVPVPADMTVGMGRSATVTEANMPEDTKTAPASAERKMPGVLTEAERAAAMETAMNEVRALAAAHTISNLGEAFIEAAIRGGVAPSIELFRGIVRSKLPQGVALRNADIGLTPKETRKFSVLRLARAMASGATKSDIDAASFEIECSIAARAEAEKAGLAVRGSYTIPSDVMAVWGDFEVDGANVRQYSPAQMNAAVRAAIGTTAGANITDTAHLADRFIDNLRNRSGVMRAGATMLPGLEGVVEIPGGNANNTAAWLAAENANVVESNPTFRKITMGPKDLGSYVDLTRRMLQQTTIALEAYVRRQIVDGITLEIDRAALYGTGTGVPTGLNTTVGIGSVAFAAAATTGIPTRSELIDMQKLIAATNQDEDGTSWIMNTSSAGDLRKTTVDAGSGVFLLGDNRDSALLGNMVVKSNQVPAGPTLNDIWLGYWSDMFIGMWGSLDLDRDTAAGFLSGSIRLRGIQTVDMAVGRVGSFVRGT